jgi:hypothetical protein
LFDTVILGLLDHLSFHGDPDDAEDRGQEIAGMVTDIKAKLEAEADEGSGTEEPAFETSEVKNDEDADDGLTMTFEEFDAAIGITRDREREEAVFSLHKVLKSVTATSDQHLADLLGLTLLGLDELKRGITAHFATSHLKLMKHAILKLEQQNRISLMHPDIAAEDIDT